MRINLATKWVFLAAALCMVSPTHAQSLPAAPEQRELIFCADKMTHEEREAYRAKMRAARSAEEKAALRQAHQQEMQARPRQSSGEVPCEPLRLRSGGGRGR